MTVNIYTVMPDGDNLTEVDFGMVVLLVEQTMVRCGILTNSYLYD